MHHFDKPLLGKHFWRVIDHRNSPLGQWVINKYVDDQRNRSFKKYTPRSFIWKSIKSCKGMIINQLKWLIGDGKETSLQDNSYQWKPLRSIAGFNRVSNLIQEQIGDWNKTLVNQLFSKEDPWGLTFYNRHQGQTSLVCQSQQSLLHLSSLHHYWEFSLVLLLGT